MIRNVCEMRNVVKNLPSDDLYAHNFTAHYVSSTPGPFGS